MIDLRYGRDCLESLRDMPDASVHTCVTSPPYYGLRDYGCDGQIGLEPTLDEFVARLVAVFAEVRRVLHPSGTCFVNIGDSYAGNGSPGGQSTRTCKGAPNARDKVPTKPGRDKSLLLAPFRFALAMQSDGWILRDVIVWHKPAPMPESVRDRCTKAWEPIFMFAKSPRYFADMEAVKTPATAPGRVGGFTGCQADGLDIVGTGNQNPESEYAAGYRLPAMSNLRNVWKLSPEAYKGKHFATFPSELPRRCIKIGTSERGACPRCRAPWRRVVERSAIKRDRPNDYVKRVGDEGTGNVINQTTAGVAVETTGWQPTCECNAGDPVPCVVLDPFCGSGTTMKVAAELGRDGIGLDLSTEYRALAVDRIGALNVLQQREEVAA